MTCIAFKLLAAIHLTARICFWNFPEFRIVIFSFFTAIKFLTLAA